MNMKFAFAVLAMLVSLVPVVSFAETPVEGPSAQAWAEIEKGALLIDVRTADEFSSGHIEGAINIPHDQIEKRLSEIQGSKGKEVVVYCKSGRRAGLAKEILEKNGFSRVLNAGGYADLVAGRHSAH